MDPSSEETEGRRDSKGLFWAVLGATAIGAFGLGMVVGVSIGREGVGNSPAIDLARQLGLALPLDQYEAFADGRITRQEVEQAITRLEACVESSGVRGFVAELEEGGTNLHTEYVSGSPDDVERCRLQQLEATYKVWLFQDRVDGSR